MTPAGFLEASLIYCLLTSQAFVFDVRKILLAVFLLPFNITAGFVAAASTTARDRYAGCQLCGEDCRANMPLPMPVLPERYSRRCGLLPGTLVKHRR